MRMFTEINEFTMANLAEHQNNDFFKFYYAAVRESKEDVHFEDEEYAHLLKIVRKEIPAKDYYSEDYEIIFGEDGDFMEYGIAYKKDATVYFNTTLVDEEEQEYMDTIFPEEKIFMVALDISKNGKEIFSPEIKIGDALDMGTVEAIFTKFVDCEVYMHELMFGQTVISVQAKDYKLELWCQDGILFSAVIKNLGQC